MAYIPEEQSNRSAENRQTERGAVGAIEGFSVKVGYGKLAQWESMQQHGGGGSAHWRWEGRF
jgi:hypothetical protein